jgi:hypothetical protein
LIAPTFPYAMIPPVVYDVFYPIGLFYNASSSSEYAYF